MPRNVNPVPTYRRHKKSGQAVVSVRQPDGTRRDVYLGPHGSPGSKAEYERLLAALRASPVSAAVHAGRPRAGGLTVNELLLAFLTHCRGHYPKPTDGGTDQAARYAAALRPVRALCGHTAAAAFGPLALKAVRQQMVDTGLSRPEVNRRVSRIRLCFRWASAEELVPVAVTQALATLAGLARGRTPAREPAPVRPADPAAVAATLPFLNRHVAAIVRVQTLTGARPGEVCRLTAAAIDRSAAVWVYRPVRHKNTHRGRRREVRIGPRAQAVLAPFLAAVVDPAAPLFSPATAREERYAAMRAARTSKVTPSQGCRKKRHPDPTKMPAAAYSPRSYAAVRDGIDSANARRERLAGPTHFDPVPAWTPYQLRHAHATAVRKRFGLEAAGASLGHAKRSATEVYAERDHGLADRVAGEIG